MKQQFLLSGVATAVVGVLLAQSVSTVATASDKQGFEPNVEQKSPPVRCRCCLIVRII